VRLRCDCCGFDRGNYSDRGRHYKGGVIMIHVQRAKEVWVCGRCVRTASFLRRKGRRVYKWKTDMGVNYEG